MRLGVLILPEQPWADAAERWRRAEALGFDHAWTYDHIAWRDFRDSPWYASLPTLSAAATATETLRIGTLVTSPNFRHPVPFARELVTLDDISGGRLTLGLGAGSRGWDATIMGQQPIGHGERAERFAEFVDLLDRLLKEPSVSFNGRHWTADDVRIRPGCVQTPRIPFAIAATRPMTMRVAARHGAAWVTTGDRSYTGPPQGPAEGSAVIASQVTMLEEACLAEGRDFATIDRLVLTGPLLDPGLHSLGAFQEVREAYAAVGVTDLVVHWPRTSEPYRADASILERIMN